MNIELHKYPELKPAYQFISEFEGSIIAGGIARDLLNGKDFEDIDIFVPVFENADLVSKTIQLTRFADKNNFEIKTNFDEYGLGGYCRFSIQNMDVCFVRQIDTKSLIEKFDMTSSQAWLEPTETGFNVHSTKLFSQLNDKKILGVYPSKCNMLSEHVKKVEEKYPDYLTLKLMVEPKEEKELPF